ncbi:HlyD family efflux transporter periplasmic adaptor subunit [Bacillus cereus]|uniref:HlyD family efflux transporter periplasmic adaptor subunit n=1 Tax=Bacillus cereus group TaxID=86661 RepID=UPI0018F54E88|nr:MULTISPECIES: HlyD family efflux transporter periplasmic adaptor subunit [Bacillus cereus group]MBJ8089670.1 HlyD family efflux transporter periplasmic adaptor subunit [Bacillus cereus]MBJ8110577.1 HlyD family efflux transporter periplasmic adaptor subunit [Bacillus cereus group sp. N6]MCU5331319.1 HlyD family secretion protein [Bacillus wiedmannii]MDY8164875.1 HlyD family efflux transporter periplasmic adaptor subunit [Bacillus thuringiensis]
MSKLYSFDQLNDSKELLERKPPRFIAGLLVFLLMSLFVFLIWAYVSKIDIVSKGTAMIQGKSDASVSRTQIVGVVDTVAVKPGDEVKKGNILIQLKNQELTDKQNQMNQIVEHLEKQKGMLEQLKESIQSHKSSFLDDVDKKIREEYQAYDQRYQSIQNEKDNEIKTIENSKISSEQDEVLQGLIAENENIQREIDIIEKQKTKENILEEQKQVMDDKKENLESQKNSVEKRIKQRKETLEHERTKVDVTKEGKQEQKKDALKQYKEESMISVNQRIQSLEQELFIKKQELDGLRHQNETTIIKAQKDGIVQFPAILQQGDLINPGQEIVSIIPKEDQKKVRILLPAQEIKGIKKGDKVQYSFKLQKTDKQMGQITYVSAYPTFDKNTKGYMYELEATIDTKDLQELHTGMVGRASVITGEETVWKFILRKLDFISN